LEPRGKMGDKKAAPGALQTQCRVKVPVSGEMRIKRSFGFAGETRGWWRKGELPAVNRCKSSCGQQ